MLDAAATKPIQAVSTRAEKRPSVHPALYTGESFPTVTGAPMLPRRRPPTMGTVTTLQAWNYQLRVRNLLRRT